MLNIFLSIIESCVNDKDMKTETAKAVLIEIGYTIHIMGTTGMGNAIKTTRVQAKY